MAVIDHAPRVGTPLSGPHQPLRQPGTPFGDFEIGDPAPGVDIVMVLPEDTHGRVLDGRTLKLIGSLHRRFWDRRRDLLMHQAQAGAMVVDASHGAEELVLDIDLTDEAANAWEGRIAKHSAIAELVDEELANGTELTDERRVAIRGWGVTEPGVLVDGRAVPGAVFDLAVAMSLGAEAFRRQQDPFMVVIPAPHDDDEAQLWNDLSDLAHDRAGIDRGTVAIITR